MTCPWHRRGAHQQSSRSRLPWPSSRSSLRISTSRRSAALACVKRWTTCKLSKSAMSAPRADAEAQQRVDEHREPVADRLAVGLVVLVGPHSFRYELPMGDYMYVVARLTPHTTARAGSRSFRRCCNHSKSTTYMYTASHHAHYRFYRWAGDSLVAPRIRARSSCPKSACAEAPPRHDPTDGLGGSSAGYSRIRRAGVLA